MPTDAEREQDAERTRPRRLALAEKSLALELSRLSATRHGSILLRAKAGGEGRTNLGPVLTLVVQKSERLRNGRVWELFGLQLLRLYLVSCFSSRLRRHFWQSKSSRGILAFHSLNRDGATI